MTLLADVDGPGTSEFLSGGGKMGALIRAHDWSSTGLGLPGRWPAALKTAIRLMLNSGHTMYVWWGSRAARSGRRSGT